MSLNVNLQWREKMQFVSQASEHEVLMDAKTPIGQGRAQTPKELLLGALTGCTGMDVIAWLRKHRQVPSTFTVQATAQLSESGHPQVFTAVHLTFEITGEVDANIALQGVELSQTEYCGVSAMLAKAFPLTWELLVNEQKAGEGRANFV